jgi:endonuclease/exonuclease/phosphatase family metal-dependent hydrolase
LHAIRIMTYQVNGCRGRDGRVDLERILEVIGEAAPDVVALQQVDADADRDQLGRLAGRLGMTWFGNRHRGANAFLSYYPLHGIREFSLGDDGLCLRADVDFLGKRLHLFNVYLPPGLRLRREQITSLLGPDLLGSNDLNCPTLVLGDFGDYGWGPGNLSLALMLRKVRRPLWCGTFPAQFPVFGRDRAYLRGDLRILETSILRWGVARQASTHLPLVLTVQVRDPRRFLRADDLAPRRMEAAPG